MIFYYSLALLAALSWSIASLISTDLTRTLGAIGFNRIRLIIVSIMLITYAYFDKTLFSINTEFLFTIITLLLTLLASPDAKHGPPTADRSIFLIPF